LPFFLQKTKNISSASQKLNLPTAQNPTDKQQKNIHHASTTFSVNNVHRSVDILSRDKKPLTTNITFASGGLQ